MPFVYIHSFWFIALTAEPWITGRTFRHNCCCWRPFVFLLPLLTLLPLQQMVSSLLLGFSLPCLAGLTALLESLLLLASVLLLACMLLFFCLQLIVCLLLLYSHRKLVSVPGCSYTSSGLLLKAAFCCRLYWSWLKTNIGKKPQDADTHPLPLREGRQVEFILNEEIFSTLRKKPDISCWQLAPLSLEMLRWEGSTNNMHECRAQSLIFQRRYTDKTTLSAGLQRRYDMNGRFQMQGVKNWILPKEINANRFFWNSHRLRIWSNHFCPSMGPNGRSVAMRYILYGLWSSNILILPWAKIYLRCWC